MTTVTENLDLPAGIDPAQTTIEVQLVGAAGVPLAEVYDQAAGKTIVGLHRLRPDRAGAWSLNLAANSALLPAGTVWRRAAYSRDRTLDTSSFGTVPGSGGPYRWDQILTTAPASIGDSALAAHAGDLTLHGGGIERGYLERTSDTGNLAVTGFTMSPIPGLVLTVPSVNRPLYLHGRIHMRHSVASATASALFAPVGAPDLTFGRGFVYTTHRAVTDPVTAAPFHRIPPNSPGDWQAYVSGPIAGNVIVVAATNGPSSIWLEAK